jgi:hypothetical protein
MKFFLLVLGAIIAINVIRRLVAGASVPPPRIHLGAAPASGRHAANVARHARELEACGFRKLVSYKVSPIKGLQLTAFGHPRESLVAVVYTHPMAGSFVDVCSKAESGRAFTATTAPTGGQLDQKPGHDKVFDKSLTIRQMVELALARRPEGPWQEWNAGNFASKFEQAYAEEMDWRAGRGGVTSDEVRRTAREMGGNFSEGDLQRATHKIQKQYAESRRQ